MPHCVVLNGLGEEPNPVKPASYSFHLLFSLFEFIKAWRITIRKESDHTQQKLVVLCNLKRRFFQRDRLEKHLGREHSGGRFTASPLSCRLGSFGEQGWRCSHVGAIHQANQPFNQSLARQNSRPAT